MSDDDTESHGTRLSRLEAWCERLFDHSGIEKPADPAPKAAPVSPSYTSAAAEINGGTIHPVEIVSSSGYSAAIDPAVTSGR